MLHLLTERKQTITLYAALFFILLGGVIAVNGIFAFPQKSEKAAVEEFPQPKGHINDFGQLLTNEEKRLLSDIAAEFEKRTTNQLAVVTVETLSPYESIEPYATKLFNTWGIGQKDKNNGVLLLITVKERKVRIEVGLGLEKALPNDKCKEILQTEVTPRLKERAFYEAVRQGMQSIIKELDKQSN